MTYSVTDPDFREAKPQTKQEIHCSLFPLTLLYGFIHFIALSFIIMSCFIDVKTFKLHLLHKPIALQMNSCICCETWPSLFAAAASVGTTFLTFTDTDTQLRPDRGIGIDMCWSLWVSSGRQIETDKIPDANTSETGCCLKMWSERWKYSFSNSVIPESPGPTTGCKKCKSKSRPYREKSGNPLSITALTLLVCLPLCSLLLLSQPSQSLTKPDCPTFSLITTTNDFLIHSEKQSPPIISKCLTVRGGYRSALKHYMITCWHSNYTCTLASH